MATLRDPRILALAAALAGIIDALAIERRADVGDDLVPFPFGFERRAARALIREGRLATTRIGRRIFTRRSAVLALVGDSANPVPAPAPVVTDPVAAARAAYAAPLRAVGGRTR
jgi:hypothetical protein